MRLGQIRFRAAITAAIFEGESARPIPDHTMSELIRGAARRGAPAKPLLPISPPEVWACGCTYEMSASFRDAEHGTREGMYAYVYKVARPGSFSRGTPRVREGPG